MMKSIDNIICEEINRLILTEDFQALKKEGKQWIKRLDNEYVRIDQNFKTIQSLKVTEVTKYARNMMVYIAQLVNAINRCMSSGNLNEGMVREDVAQSWGFKTPEQLNPWQNMKKWWNKADYEYQRLMDNGKGNKYRNLNVKDVPLEQLVTEYYDEHMDNGRDLGGMHPTEMNYLGGAHFNILAVAKDIATKVYEY